MKEYKNKIFISAKTLLFPILMVLIVGPMEVYYSNITDFNFLLKDFIYMFVIASVALLVVGSLLISLLPKKIYEIVICIIISGSLELYIQNAFLNGKLSNADGTQLNWDELKAYVVTNTIISAVVFLVILVVIILIWKKVKNVEKITVVPLLMSFLQVVAIVTCIIQISNSGRNFDEYHIGGKDQFSVAPNDNIIILIADTTTANMFTNLYNEDPSIAEGFEDFTFYNNYESDYSGTYPSVLQMMTGNPIDVAYTRMENAANGWNSERSKNFYNKLHDNEYTCNLFAACWLYEFGEAKPMLGSIDNVGIAERKITQPLLTVMMLKYSLYKVVPYALKPSFEVIDSHYRDVAYYDDEIEDYNIPFYEKLKSERLTINNEWNNALILEHFEGMHPPISVAADVTYDENATPEDQFRAVMVIYKEYLSQLKELGLYDNATIYLIADHGNQREGAIFLLKNKNEKHEKMQINNAPIDAKDFQATILSIIGEDYSDYGTTIFDWNEGDERERTRSWVSPEDYYFNLYGHTYTGDAMVLDNFDDYDVENIGLK